MQTTYPSESAIFDLSTLDVQKDEMLIKKPRFKIQLLIIQTGNQILKEMLINSKSHYPKLIVKKNT